MKINTKINKIGILFFGILTLISCGSDDIEEPIIEPENVAPSLVVNNLNVNDADNTISFNANGNDTDGTIVSYNAFLTKVNGENENLTINSNGQTNQEITNTGVYNKLTVITTDNDGETANIENTITLTVENITINYTAETEITVNSINEQTAGKIASFSTIVNKTVDTDGTEVTTSAIGGTITITITGTDANLLEVIGNEVHVKSEMGKDVEDSEGNDMENNKFYDFGITTNVTGLENGNTAEDIKTAESTDNAENIDLDDFEPFPNLIVELNGETRVEYINTVSQANTLSHILAESTGIALLDKIGDAAGSDFTRTTYNIAGLNISYLNYQGSRFDGASMSRILAAIYKARDTTQTGNVTDMITDTDLTTYIAKGLQNVTFTTYSGTTNAGSEIEITIEEAAQIGAAAIVAKNIADGVY